VNGAARFARIVSLSVAISAAGARAVAFATPFSDVPSDHWAYQDLQSLAADGLVDGYPDGSFKGDRPLTRYEMAVVVARVIAKLQERGEKTASKEDLDRLQKLVDALKDELDALGVRVSSLEDSLGALDRKTAFAQSLSLHGTFLPNITSAQDVLQPASIVNRTGAPVTTYYGASVAPGAAGGIDPLVGAYLATNDTNDPLTSQPSGIQIRQDDRFALTYAASDQLTVTLPVHILNFAYGGDFSQDAKFDIEPGVDIGLAKVGAISNLHVEFGSIEKMTSSLTGLAFRAPQGYDGAQPFEEPLQPPQKGALVRGTVGEGAFGATDFEASFTRVDQTLLNTQPGTVAPDVLPFGANQYFYPIVAPQAGFAQTSAAGALKTDVFHAGTETLSQVFLSSAAVNGSVYVASYNGTTFDSSGRVTGGAPQSAPAFAFDAAYNDVVFAFPLPPGSVVGIAYRDLSETNDTAPQRYMTHLRVDQHFKGYAGAQVGVTYNRVFDVVDGATAGSGTTGGLVSDGVLGIDAQLPLPFTVLGPGSSPVVYGEAAESNFTPDTATTSAVSDFAGVGGVKLHAAGTDLTLQYQSVGPNFFSGAPLGYYGNVPQLFASNRLAYLPGFFGFGNDLGINQEFDGQFAATGVASPNARLNPNLTFLTPLFNPLEASGPQYYSAFAPNSQGLTASANTPFRIGATAFAAHASYQNLAEIAPNGGSTALYGPSFVTSDPLRYTTYTLGTDVRIPAFGDHATVNLSGTYETLKRSDTTAQQYYPIDPSTNAYDATSIALANVAFPTGGPFGPGSQIAYYPNYVNVRHYAYGIVGSLPIARNLTLNASYSQQRYGGSYGTTVAQNISERKDYYTGSLTYVLPRTNSSLTFLEQRYEYRDDVLPNYDFGQNRQDLTFSVRF
jgi:hypothetical protein